MLRLVIQSTLSVLVFIVLFTFSVSCSFQTNLPSKCCNQISEIKEVDGSLNCRNKSSDNQRWQIYSNSQNFLNTTGVVNGECVDTENGQFFTYQINGKYYSKKPSLSYFPKCCPLGYVYNMKIRACKPNNSTNKEPFKMGSFLKIGLPHCRLIIDTKYQDFNAVVNILINKENSFCLDQTEPSDKDDSINKLNYVVRECQKDLNICKHKRCFKKCCSDGRSYFGGGVCYDTFIHGFQIEGQTYSPYIEHPIDNYELIYGAGCKHLSMLLRNNIQYKIQKNGNFRSYYNYSRSFREEKISDMAGYCIEYAEKGNISAYHLFICAEKPVPEKIVFTLISKIFSCIFLFITMAIYFYLKETKTNFGKILINYCLTTMLLMITLIISHVYLLGVSRVNCKIRGYLIILFNSSAFAWVNIMSIDIWCTFSAPNKTIGYTQKRQETKKILLYLLYGWGLPICHVIFIVALAKTSFLPESIQPYVGVYYCNLENRNYARTLFLLTPLLIFQIISTVLFVKTVVYCLRVKNEIYILNDSKKNREYGKLTTNIERLSLIFKLAVIMGIIWIIEITTAFVSKMSTYSKFTKILEIVLDNIVCLQGVFIFLIFICKKKTISKLRKRIFHRQMSNSTSDTQMIQINGSSFPINKRQTRTTSINAT